MTGVKPRYLRPLDEDERPVAHRSDTFEYRFRNDRRDRRTAFVRCESRGNLLTPLATKPRGQRAELVDPDPTDVGGSESMLHRLPEFVRCELYSQTSPRALRQGLGRCSMRPAASSDLMDWDEQDQILHVGVLLERRGAKRRAH